MPSHVKEGRRQIAANRSQTCRLNTKDRRSGSPKPTSGSAFINIALVSCLVLATVAVYFSVGRNPFIVYDDQVYITDNVHVKAGLSWETVTWALKSTEASNWHPITWLSHALDYDLFGLNPSGHHWMSLFIHAVNAVLLFYLLQRVSGDTWRSLFVAALFALHPLNVESVAWAAERKNVLSTTFFLLALGAYGSYVCQPSVRRYTTLAMLFALGLATKPMVITLPFVLLLLDFWPLRRIEYWTKPSDLFPVVQASPKRLVLEKLPLLLLSLGGAIITIIAQQPSVVPGQALPLDVRLQNALYAYGAYVWRTAWPLHLALIYPHPGRTLGFWRPMLGALLILFGVAVGWLQRTRRPYIVFGWLWFLGTAVPIIGIMQVGVQVVADRYAYVPLLGIFLIVSWILLPPGSDFNPRTMTRRGIPAVVILAALGFLTWRQVGYWRSTIDVWSHALQVTEKNTLAENFLAGALIDAGRHREGMEHLRNYAALEPLDPGAHVRVAADYQDSGQLNHAVSEYNAAIRASEVLGRYGSPGLNPEMLAITYSNLALTYAQLGDPAKSQECAAKALATDADAISKMIGSLSQVLAAHPAAKGYVRLGMLLQEFGHPEQAGQAFAQAHQLDPSVPVLAGGDVGKKSN
jgi:hypothetical protein